MKNILVTEFSNNNANVMIHTEQLTVDEIKERLDCSNESYTDVIEVPDSDVWYYHIDERYWY